MIFFLRVTVAISGIDAYLVHMGWMEDDPDEEQQILRGYYYLLEEYGPVEVPYFGMLRDLF